MGVRDFETKDPVLDDTLFHAASLSKPLFAYGALTFVQAGVLDLDKPLHTYLPLPEADEISQLKTTTARHILSHTSGLQNWRIKTTDKFKFAFAPGLDFPYSGEGFYYLQCVVEQISGQSIEMFLQEHVLRPLGMHRSTFAWRNGYESEISMGHRDRGNKVVPWIMQYAPEIEEIITQTEKPFTHWLFYESRDALPQIDPEATPMPYNFYPNVAFSLLTTAPEFAQFVLCLLNPDDAVARLMLTAQHTLTHELAWGLGIGLERVNNDLCFWHWDNMGIFTSFVFGNTVTCQDTVIFTNDLRGLQVCERILQEFNGRHLDAFMWL